MRRCEAAHRCARTVLLDAEALGLLLGDAAQRGRQRRLDLRRRRRVSRRRGMAWSRACTARACAALVAACVALRASSRAFRLASLRSRFSSCFAFRSTSPATAQHNARLSAPHSHQRPHHRHARMATRAHTRRALQARRGGLAQGAQRWRPARLRLLGRLRCRSKSRWLERRDRLFLRDIPARAHSAAPAGGVARLGSEGRRVVNALISRSALRSHVVSRHGVVPRALRARGQKCPRRALSAVRPARASRLRGALSARRRACAHARGACRGGGGAAAPRGARRKRGRCAPGRPPCAPRPGSRGGAARARRRRPHRHPHRLQHRHRL